MRRAGHPQRRKARPAAPDRQTLVRAPIVARRAAAVLLMVAGAVLGLYVALVANVVDGRSLLAVALLLAGYSLGLRTESRP